MQRLSHGPAPLMRGTAALAVALAVLVGGCDWFDKPVETNIPPETWMTGCPSDELVSVGEDVVLSWGGTDYDGRVAGYEWVLDDTLSAAMPDTAGATPDTMLTIEDVGEGHYKFEVAAIDGEGEADPTPAVCEFTVAQGGGPVERVVLAELLTTKLCPNCPNAEQALDELIDEYGRDRFCVVAYHFRDEQNPDAVATDESIARIQWYYDNHEGVGAVQHQFPLVIFDGGSFFVGASSVTQAKANYEARTDPRMAIDSPLSLELDGEIGGAAGDVTATLTVHDAIAPGDYVLHMVAIENGVIVGIDHFDFVARLMYEEGPLTMPAVGGSASFAWAFDMGAGWNPNEMDVIAFVQNEATLEVMQAGRLLTQ